MSISSTVATDVGLTTGVRSTGSRRRAASTRSRLVMGATVSLIGSSLLCTRRDEDSAGGLHLLLAERGAQVLGPLQHERDERVMVVPARERDDLAVLRRQLRELGERSGDRRCAARRVLGRSVGVNGVARRRRAARSGSSARSGCRAPRAAARPRARTGSCFAASRNSRRAGEGMPRAAREAHEPGIVVAGSLEPSEHAHRLREEARPARPPPASSCRCGRVRRGRPPRPRDRERP